MRIVVMLLVLFTTVFAQSVDCTQVFEERKSEILSQLEKIDAQRQSFEALQAATKALFKREHEKLNSQRDELNSILYKIELEKTDMKKREDANQKLLSSIDSIKDEKITKMYANMKDSAAADILSELSISESAAIIFTLQAKKASKIMAKMNPKVASQITQRLVLGPPFK